jgi:DNA-binding beta-propeller fold protein YncE
LTLRGFRGPTSGVALSPDGKLVAAALRNSAAVRVWDPVSGQELRTLYGANGGLVQAVFSPDGRRLAAAGAERVLRVWDVETGKVVVVCSGHSSSISNLAFSPDGRRLASVSRKNVQTGEVKIWNADTGQALLTIDDPTEQLRTVITGVAFSPDGQHLATTNQGKTVKLWDAATGRLLHAFRGHDAVVMRVAYSPRGRLIASASDDGTARIWDATTGKEVFTLRGHTREVIAVAFNPDGTRLATASNDYTVRIWDVDSGLEILTLRGHTRNVYAVAFSADGQRIASAGHDETVRIWDATPPTPELRRLRQAGTLVNRLTAQWLLKDEVAARLRGDAALEEPLRQRCLELLGRYHEDPERLRLASWAVVSRPGAEAAEYRLALRQAQAGLDAASSADGLNWRHLYTLGLAQYRAGRWENSLATLTKAEAAYAAWDEKYRGKLSPRANLRPAPLDVFRAMVQYQLGHADEARAALDDLRKALATPAWTKNEQERAFAREAETLIEGKSPED